MRPELIKHRPRGNFAYPIGNGEAEIMIEVGKDDVNKIECIYFDQYLVHEDREYVAKTIEMSYVASSEYRDSYRCRVKPPRNRLGYFFKIYFKSGEEKYLNEVGLIDNANSKDLNQFCIPYLNEEDAVKTPEWVKTAVCYQIYPDGFATDKGELDFNPKGDNQYKFAGGTLKGIKEKIPYLKDLGITAIYTTPIFKANTCHRYETVDYMEIDPKLGTKEDFKELVDELHKNGIKIILDGVFNHTSSHFFAFQDVLKNQEKSKYASWYYIDKFPVKPAGTKPDFNLPYETFASVSDMPKFNTCNPEVTEYILGVVSYWTKEFGVDGWRLDVANEIPLHFWRKFRETLKKINPETYIIGESWNDSNCYLEGDVFDGVMNYLFRNYTFRLFNENASPIVKNKIIYDVDKFIARYSDHLIQYPKPIFDTLMNLVDSHDVERIRDDFKDERVVKCITTMQLTLSGMPCIYYGTERGIASSKELGNRPAIHWDQIDQEVFDFYKKLIAIRNENKACSLGDITFDRKYPNVLKYTKTYGDNEITVIINTREQEVELDEDFDNLQVLYQTNLGNKNTLRSYDIIILKK